MTFLTVIDQPCSGLICGKFLIPLRQQYQYAMSRIFRDHCLICQSHHHSVCFEAIDYTSTGESFQISECLDCGFRFTANPPSEADCGIYYQSQDYISHSDTTEGLVNKLYHRIRTIMLGRKERLCRAEGVAKSLLDFGSGTGYFAKHMKNAGFDVLGVEMDDKAREYSRKQWGLNVISTGQFLEGIADRHFGYITLWHVLEHLYDPDRYIKIFYGLLEDSGRLIIAVPNFRGYEAGVYGRYWAGYDVPRHLWHFHADAMQRLAERNGFKVVKMEGMPFDPFYNAMLSEKYMNHSLPLIRGSFHGFRSWLSSLTDPRCASSVIYVMEKIKPSAQF